MALDLNQLNSTTMRLFDKKVVDSAYDLSAFFKILKSKHKFKKRGGTQVQFPIIYRKLAQTGSVGPREQMEFSAKDTFTGGVLDWKFYRGQVMIPWDDRVKNRGASEIASLVAEKTKELTRDAVDILSTDLFATTQATNSIQGLDEIVDAGDTYAGVAVADAANWASTEDTTTTVVQIYGASTSLSASINATTQGNEGPTHIITTRNLKSKIESLLEPNKRYEDVDTANLGIRNISCLGLPVIGDGYCTANYLYGLNMNMFEVFVQEGEDMYMSDWMDLALAGFPKSVGKYCTNVMNIVCRNRRTNFKFSALDYTAS